MTQTWSYNADGSLHELIVTGITGHVTPRATRFMPTTSR